MAESKVKHRADRTTAAPTALWSDVRRTLAWASPIYPTPDPTGIAHATPISAPAPDGLAIQEPMKSALVNNWNELRKVYATPSPWIAPSEAAGFDTAGQVVDRIAGIG